MAPKKRITKKPKSQPSKKRAFESSKASKHKDDDEEEEQPLKKYDKSPAKSEEQLVDPHQNDKHDETQELTESVLKQHDLKTKLEALEKGRCSDDLFWKTLGPKEQQALWKRYEYGRCKSQSASDAWDHLKTLRRGDSKDLKKRLLLLAFLKEGKCGEQYFKAQESLLVTKEDEKSLRWVPWEECKRWYGESEAKARVSSGSLAVRKCPRDTRFFEFLLVSETATSQKRVVETARSTKLSKQEYKSLAQGIMAEQDEGMLEDLLNMADDKIDISLKDVQAMQSDDDLDLDPELRATIQGKVVAKDTKGKETKGKETAFDAKLDKMSQVDGGTGQELALTKCAQMHTFLSKQVMEVRQLESKCKQSKLLPEEVATAVTSGIEGLQASIEILDEAVVERKASVESCKEMLVNAAKRSKKTKKMAETLKVLLKTKQ